LKYLIAAAAPNFDAKIAKRFGHAPYYIILDPVTRSFEAIKGVSNKEPSYNIGHFIGKGIGAVILGNVGPNAFRNLIAAGWIVYSCIGLSVKEAVDKVSRGEVASLKTPTMKRSVRPGSN